MVSDRALIYCRYSPRPEDRCESLGFQAEFVQRYFEFLGVEVDRVIFDPDTSARLTPLIKREGGRQLIRLTTGRCPQFRKVGVYRLDRLWRDVVDGNITLKLWKRAGVSCHFAAEGGCSLNTSTATGRFLVNILLAKAAYEPDLTSERTSAAMLRHMENGWAMGGKPPYGLKLGVKKLAPNGVMRATLLTDKAERRVIAEIFAMHKQGYSLRKMADILNSQKTPCRGDSWDHTKIKRILDRQMRVDPECGASSAAD